MIAETLRTVEIMIGRVGRAVRGLLQGLKFGYPFCCVLNYSFDTLLGLPSGLSRGETSSTTLGPYVPCHYHKKLNALSRRECLELIKGGYLVERLAPNAKVEMFVNGKVVSAIYIPEGIEGLLLQQIKLTESH